MKKMKLDHKRLNLIQMNSEAFSEFQQYYIREASKSFMGLESDFSQGKSRKVVFNNIIPILKEFELLKDEDPFYDSFKSFTNLRNEFSDKLLESPSYKEALDLINDVNNLLNNVNFELKGE